MSLRHEIGARVRKLIGHRAFSYVQAKVKPENWFLAKIHGIIHIGANTGQERFIYDTFGLRVLWMEPISTVFASLTHNIAAFPKQRALNYLVTAEDGKEYIFHIANNDGASSSIFGLSKHKEMFPYVTYMETITLVGARLGTILHREGIDVSQYDALVLDTQGAEYDILRGAADILPQFKFIKVEAPDFEAYENCCRVDALSAFLVTQGFKENRRIPFCHKDGVGTYFEVIYSRT